MVVSKTLSNQYIQQFQDIRKDVFLYGYITTRTYFVDNSENQAVMASIPFSDRSGTKQGHLVFIEDLKTKETAAEYVVDFNTLSMDASIKASCFDESTRTFLDVQIDGTARTRSILSDCYQDCGVAMALGCAAGCFLFVPWAWACGILFRLVH